MNTEQITQFLHTQINAWNAGDKAGFFDAYRKAAPNGLQIEYVGRGPATDGWAILEGMWAQQSAKIKVEEVAIIVNGSEAACHNRNLVNGTALVIDTVELYRFDAGHLSIRYFIGPVA